MRIKKSCVALLAVFAFACVGTEDESTSAQLELENNEIVENLLAAGYPAEEIDVLESGVVIVGNDAVVSLEASREMAGVRRGPSELEDEDEFRQYATNNLVSGSISKICIRTQGSWSGTNLTALNNAVAKYNAEGLSFSMAVNGTGCGATINANLVAGSGGVAGFPSGGLPYGEINIGTSIASYGEKVVRHVIMHELGHCIGFRHSDYYNRSISCGSGGNEGSAGIGANLIPGTPSTAVYNGSVMNSCYNTSVSGSWTSTDQTALDALYGGGGGGGGLCTGFCGGYSSVGSCWCDSLCAQYGDCCSDKVQVCG